MRNVNMRTVEQIQAEIAETEAELDRARAEMRQLQDSITEEQREQENDEEWKAASWDYINKGDRTGIDNWYSRRELSKQNQVEKDKAAKEELYKLERAVNYAKQNYDDYVGTHPLKDRTSDQKAVALAYRREYERAVADYDQKAPEDRRGRFPALETEQGTEQGTGQNPTKYNYGRYERNGVKGRIKDLENSQYKIPDAELNELKEYAEGLRNTIDGNDEGQRMLDSLEKLESRRASKVDARNAQIKKDLDDLKKNEDFDTLYSKTNVKYGNTTFTITKSKGKNGKWTVTVKAPNETTETFKQE